MKYLISFFAFLIALSSVTPSEAAGSEPFSPAYPAAVTDSAYNANHPILLFDRSELPALIKRVTDGGRDDQAFGHILDIVHNVYPTRTETEMMDDMYGMDVPLNLGLVAFLESPMDTAAYALGRHMTLFVAENYDLSEEPFYASLRMRSLAFGYDMFFGGSSDSVRAYVRDRIITYMNTAMTRHDYEEFLYRPYVSNKSAMIGASLGMAAICLQNEIAPDVVEAAIQRADEYVSVWHEAHLDPDGA
jgi:hypothetical protein